MFGNNISRTDYRYMYLWHDGTQHLKSNACCQRFLGCKIFNLFPGAFPYGQHRCKISTLAVVLRMLKFAGLIYMITFTGKFVFICDEKEKS